MRGWRGGGGGVEAGVRVHLQEVVGLVFEDDEVVFLGDGVDVFTALRGLRGAGWVLALFLTSESVLEDMVTTSNR